ncbi:MAG: hypothetical protein DLM60_19960 [Pseudonocardiales bacterium]|nr:hypothetical protein [Actinomycetota bacterium]PZS13948.1 MAG: hypothetical protein DLM60_19960 [Pseudonocardiales bacterium]
MTAPHSPTSPAETKTSPAETKPKADLNPARVVAAALAAVTTAVVGSKLGATGTLIGAAGASVITTVGTAVYQTSLERSRKRVRSLAQRARPSPEAQPKPAPSQRSRRSATLRWGAVIVGSLGAFLLAMTVITGFEWANGGTVGGNGNGTTIGRVINDRPAAPKPTTPLRPADPAVSETPTETPPPPGGILPGNIGDPTTTTPEPTPTRSSDAVTPTPPPLIPPILGSGG